MSGYYVLGPGLNTFCSLKIYIFEIGAVIAIIYPYYKNKETGADGDEITLSRVTKRETGAANV